MRYTVHLIHSVSTTVDVGAESIEEAIDLALQEAPSPINSSNHGIDPDGEWTENAVYDETGSEVWREGSWPPSRVR